MKDMNLLHIVLIYLVTINVVTFFIYGFDKWKAKKSKMRIREIALLGLAVLGGSIGAWLEMKAWHHKTLHKKFKYGVPTIIIIQLAIIVYYIYMNSKMDPMGRAIAEYWKTKKADRLRVFSPMFEEDEIPLKVLFRSYKAMPEIERKALDKILAPGGQVLCDSSDISYVFEDETGMIDIPEDMGYYGEHSFQMQYKDTIGEPFDWLYIDADTLRQRADRFGYVVEVLAKGDHYDYLARITKKV